MLDHLPALPMNRTRSRSRARSNDGLSTPSRILAACSALWAVLMTTMPVAKAQDEVCSCSPSTYEFRFNFDLRCPRPGEDYGPGISEVTCFITSYSADVLDLNPIEVQSISIVESDIERVPIAQSAVDGEFRDGSTFTYSSVSALGDDNARIPQSIQLTITATNTVGEVLVQVWAIKFTNDCGVFPVLEVGESFGWTEFVSVCSWYYAINLIP
mgnify:CR=1 FL=1